jgi:hypothetical protein
MLLLADFAAGNLAECFAQAKRYFLAASFSQHNQAYQKSAARIVIHGQTRNRMLGLMGGGLISPLYRPLSWKFP